MFANNFFYHIFVFYVPNSSQSFLGNEKSRNLIYLSGHQFEFRNKGLRSFPDASGDLNGIHARCSNLEEIYLQ